MDFGVASLNKNGSFASENVAAESKDQHRWYGSGFLKQDRTISEDDFRDFKVAKTTTCGEELRIPLQIFNGSSNITEEGSQQMLSFSSLNSHAVTWPYLQHFPSDKTTGVNGGVNMHGVISGIRAPFTPSQWMELEHQALIYKYITANVPIPSTLLNPIRKAFQAAGFSSFSPHSLGWGAFHLGFSSTDPEPGRCRRTDGKKWRCSRDAVADQKYCERHMNRGRHRSRKPVEGQAGRSASGIGIATTTAGKLPTPNSSSKPASVVPPGGGGVSNTIKHCHHQFDSLMKPGLPNVIRSLPNKDISNKGYQHATSLSMASPKSCLEENQYYISKQSNAYGVESSSLSEFGLVCSDSLLNPLNRTSSIVNCGRGNASDNLGEDGNKSQHSFRQFMDDWPKNQSEHQGTISWPEIDMEQHRTQLSISIPIVTSSFVSPTLSPAADKLRASPSRREFQATQMGLSVGTVHNEQHIQRHANWIPISWEPSLGGPLGEALHAANNCTVECNNAKALNLIECWDNMSPRSAASPTAVLHKGAISSLSNSSAGSSPRARSSRTHDGTSLCNGLIMPGQMNPPLPAL